MMQFSACLPNIVTGAGLIFVFFFLIRSIKNRSDQSDRPWGVYVSHSLTRTGDIFMTIRQGTGSKAEEFVFHHDRFRDDDEPVTNTWSEEHTGRFPHDDEQYLLTAMYVAARAREVEAKPPEPTSEA